MIHKPGNMGSFMQNFMSADGSGDHAMKRDVLISEIAKIIVSSPRKVMGHLKLYGFAIKQNASTDELATAVSKALQKSPRFALKMAHEILGGNYGAAGQTDTQIAPVISPTPVATTVSPVSGTTAAPTTATPQTAPVIATSGQSTVLPTAPAPTSTTSSPVNPTPIVTGLGQVFGGLTPIYSIASPGFPTYTTNAGILAGLGSGGGDRVVGGGDSGFGGGGGASTNEQATEELKAKANAIKGGGLWSVKKKIAFGLLIGTVIGGGYYLYKNG